MTMCWITVMLKYYPVYLFDLIGIQLLGIADGQHSTYEHVRTVSEYEQSSKNLKRQPLPLLYPTNEHTASHIIRPSIECSNFYF